MAGKYGAISEMGTVEVLEPHDRAYFTACMVDIQEGGKETLVRYQNETELTWVDSARVRARPPPRSPQEMSTYDPPEGERVEVLFEEEQESWWEGEVRTKKGGFFVIAFPDEGDSETSEVVERERLRPRMFMGFIWRRMFSIPRGMEQNVKATEAQLPKLAKHAELFALNLSPDGKSFVRDRAGASTRNRSKPLGLAHEEASPDRATDGGRAGAQGEG